jgi:N-acyl-L-homoserine lactone synthetase
MLGQTFFLDRAPNGFPALNQPRAGLAWSTCEEPTVTIEAGVYTRLSEALFRTVFADRHHQFVARHKWDLCVTPEGYELDEYDRDGAEYLVVHRQGRHLASCRLRSASSRTMLLDHFAKAFPRAEDFLRFQPGRMYELTRFLKSPALNVREGAVALLNFARALDRFRDEREAVGFVAVVYPSVSRFLRQSGVRFLVLDVSTLDGKKVELICLTQAVAVARLLGRQRAYVLDHSRRRPLVSDPDLGASLAA